ncbi:MAG: multicopper oxidase domain-containing protein [Gammaproteobacteria bacterium]|nr:multicopper oxidase domain-containing protein [Gammaproteobacteria bacterium]
MSDEEAKQHITRRELLGLTALVSTVSACSEWLPSGETNHLQNNTRALRGQAQINANEINIQANIAPRFQSLTPGSNNTISLRATNMDPPPVSMSDGAQLVVWSFNTTMSGGFNGDRVFPAPLLEVVEGQLVSLVLFSAAPHTIHLHGLDVDQANDGVPTTSGYVSGAMPFPMPGTPFGSTRFPSPFAYVFTAPQAGTYMYHCHVDTVLHMEMGMSGGIIVRPPDGDLKSIWSGGPQFDREFVWHLHTVDSTWHQFRASNRNNTVRYRPDYFLINGKEGAPLMDDPVSAIHAFTDERVLVRLINVGYLPASINFGDINFEVVSSDGRPLGRTIVSNEFVVAPGERYDVLFTMPPAFNAIAKVDYFNIMGTRILGTALTSMMSV